MVEIIDSTGAKVAQYTYNAWGYPTAILDGSGNKVTSLTHIAKLNPFRYRGYYYEDDVELYYLQSRYYDPQTGRFINTDGYINTSHILGNNVFAYCYNNPIIYSDYTGCYPVWALAGAGTAAAADGPLPFGDIIAVGILIAGGIYVLATAEPVAVPTQTFNLQVIEGGKSATPVIPITPPADNSKSSIQVVPKPKPSDNPKQQDWPTYYHATSADNAAMIMASGALMGSTWEGGYVFAWGKCPTKKALRLSGAHSGVLISFQTKAAFERDKGIKNDYVRGFNPLRSVNRGPVTVTNVQLVFKY